MTGRPHEDRLCQCKGCETWDIDAGLRALERALLRPHVSPADREAMDRLIDAKQRARERRLAEAQNLTDRPAKL